jgi:hypothetical protein
MFGFLLPFAAKIGIPERFQKTAVFGVLALLILGAMWGGKCAYDRSVIRNHEAKQDAANAKADRAADQKAAEQRRADDSRSSTEAQQIKEAVNEAGSDPAARRAAYYRCVRAQQSARKSGKPSPGC